MNKWLKIGAGLLLLAWAPFIYAELTSSPAEKKERDLPSDERHADDEVGAQPVEPGVGPVAGKPGAATAPAEPAPEAKAAQAPAAAAPSAAAEEPADPNAPDPAEPAEAENEADEEEAQEDEVPPPVVSGPVAQLKPAFDTEPRDALWAKDTEHRIAALFATAEAPDGLLERVSCRRAVCRIDVRWTRENATHYVAVYESLRDQLGSEVAVEPLGAVDEEGHQSVHVYVLRKGYTTADLAK